MPFFKDTNGDYEKFAQYCEDNGLLINKAISNLITNFLVQKGVKKKK